MNIRCRYLAARLSVNTYVLDGDVFFVQGGMHDELKIDDLRWSRRNSDGSRLESDFSLTLTCKFPIEDENIRM
jgi:hypothetical protein